MERTDRATGNMLEAVCQHAMRDKRQEIARQLNGYLDGSL